MCVQRLLAPLFGSKYVCCLSFFQFYLSAISTVRLIRNGESLRIPDDAHEKLTALLGTLPAQSAKMQTCQDAIEALLKELVILPADVIAEVESFIKGNKQLGYTTKEEFVRDSIRRRLDVLNEEYELIEIPKGDSDELDEAIGEMNLEYSNARESIHSQIDAVLEEYKRFKKEREKTEKEQEEEP